MFSSAAVYSLTPRPAPGPALSASPFCSSAARQSVRLKRRYSVRVDNTPGTFVRLGEESAAKRRPRPASPATPLALPADHDKENNNCEEAPSSLRRRCSTFFSSQKRRRTQKTRQCSVRNLGPALAGAAGSDSDKASLSQDCGPGKTVRAGYMYKRSGTAGVWRRKYVRLASNGVLSYFPSFRNYVENTAGKHIQLGVSTVRVPGEAGGGTGEVVGEMMEILSLDSRQWQFQLCSQEERVGWVAAIQQQISLSLTGRGRQGAELDAVRALPGNAECADCGETGEKVDWASLNLGTVICIECSGIHRALGCHVSKVRSLSLDSWSESQLRIMLELGNVRANSVWEGRAEARRARPGPRASRQAKQQFIRAKYLDKAFLAEEEEGDYRERLVAALLQRNISTILEIFVRHAGPISSQFPFRDKQLAGLLLEEENLFLSQLLAWYKSMGSEDNSGLQPELELHKEGAESVLL